MLNGCQYEGLKILTLPSFFFLLTNLSILCAMEFHQMTWDDPTTFIENILSYEVCIFYHFPVKFVDILVCMTFMNVHKSFWKGLTTMVW